MKCPMYNVEFDENLWCPMCLMEELSRCEDPELLEVK